MTQWATIPGLPATTGHVYLMGYNYDSSGFSVWCSSKAKEEGGCVGYRLRFHEVALFMIEIEPIDCLEIEHPAGAAAPQYTDKSELLDRVRSNLVTIFGGSSQPSSARFHIHVQAREYRMQIVCDRLPDVIVNDFPKLPLFPQFVSERAS